METNTDFTIIARVFLKSTGSFPGILVKSNVLNEVSSQYAFYLYSTERKLTFIRGTNTSVKRISSLVVPLNTWTYIAIAHNSTNITFYMDEQTETLATTPTTSSSSTTNKIGSWTGSTGVLGNWNGTIDDVMVFDRTLSSEQLYTIFNNRTDLMVSQETELGETWQVCATPSDGNETGATVCSNSITIGQAVIQIPEFSTITLLLGVLIAVSGIFFVRKRF